MRKLLQFLFKILFRFSLYRPENLPQSGPALVMPNHVSFLDGIFLYAFLPVNTCFVINREIAQKLGWTIRWVNHLLVDPLNPFSLKEVIHQVKAGNVAVIFPEGRISTTGNLMKVYNGVGLIALKTGAPIIPVILIGPERSIFSRVSNKIPSVWFPRVSLHAFSPRNLKLSDNLSFRLQKQNSSAQILRILQESLFAAREEVSLTTNLYDELLVSAKNNTLGKIIVEDISGKASYRNLLQGSQTIGKKLADDVSDERIGVLLPNSIAHVSVLMGLSAWGKTPAIFNFTAGADHILHSAQSADLQTVVTSRRFIEQASLDLLIENLSHSLQIIYLEDIASKLTLIDKLCATWRVFSGRKAQNAANELILFTSGSESKPKGVLLSQRALMSNIRQISSVIDYSPADRLLNALPMFHSFGLTAGTLLPLFGGLFTFLYPSPLHYRVIPEVIYDRNITALLGTPTFLSAYARFAHPYDFYALRLVLAGGERLTEEVRSTWLEKFGVRILEGYGTTETGPVLALNTLLFSKIGTVGRMLPGITWQIEPVEGIEVGGDLQVKGPNLMTGYLKKDQPFEPLTSWYDCGDIVTIDDEGFVRITARLKRFAKISGEMISLDGVEKWSAPIDSKAQYATIALGDSKKGEQIWLYTTAKDLNRESLRNLWSENGYPMLTLPSRVIVLEKLPALASGKTDYQALSRLSKQE